MHSIRFVTLASSLVHWGAGNAENIRVNVGEGGLYFVHPDIKANPGDIIIFGFGGPNGGPGGNHSVTQSADFSTPCLPKEGGFNSGFVNPTLADDEIGGVSWQLLINDTEPIWYYCAQIGHCQGGMVGSINANLSAGSNETFADFSSLATQATTASIPSTTGGGRLITGSAGYSGSSTTSTATLSTTSVSSRGSISTTTGPTLPTVPIISTLPPTSATSASSIQTVSNATLSSTAAASTASVAAATAAARGAELGLMKTVLIAACFMPALFLI